jgi:hypothetical protein
MILMGVRDEDCLDFAVCDGLEIRQRVFAHIFGMHPAIQHQPVSANLKIIGVRADLRAAGEVDEFQRATVKASMRGASKTKPLL